jgi:hypothetical protein
MLGDLALGAKRDITCGMIIQGGQAVAAELKIVVDAVMAEGEALRLMC